MLAAGDEDEASPPTGVVLEDIPGGIVTCADLYSGGSIVKACHGRPWCEEPRFGVEEPGGVGGDTVNGVLTTGNEDSTIERFEGFHVFKRSGQRVGRRCPGVVARIVDFSVILGPADNDDVTVPKCDLGMQAAAGVHGTDGGEGVGFGESVEVTVENP